MGCAVLSTSRRLTWYLRRAVTKSRWWKWIFRTKWIALTRNPVLIDERWTMIGHSMRTDTHRNPKGPDTFIQTLFFWVLCKDCFKWKLIAMFNFDTYNWVARTLLFVWTISIQYSQGQFGTWIIVQINYNWMQPDTILWTLFYKHSSFWFFARTVLNENW